MNSKPPDDRYTLARLQREDAEDEARDLMRRYENDREPRDLDEETDE